ncbi:hypothetical protein POTOM_048359 [Populus tomentosa]|uniref:J domain-containing protein n=1 Tax=Populus tomentosa TaxID=118781 RepID=A0A8X7Y8Z1_POPTO|nr:hypothetical protein POTOM_048359 [Populus tomentosa]
MPVKMSEVGPCYYSVLGLCKQASDSEIRDAYRKLALKWHPDRWLKDQVAAGQAKRQFQQIQEAYSVLSDKGKKRIYDAGMLGFLGDDDDEGFCDFVQEMVLMMEDVRSKEEGSTLEDLQALLMGMMTEDERILPQLLYYFGVKNDVDSLDWVTIVVYTCKASCEAGMGYKEEFPWDAALKLGVLTSEEFDNLVVPEKMIGPSD